MRSGPLSTLVRRPWLALALPWVLLWFLPWRQWIGFLPWVRLGIALALFVLPGSLLSLLLVRKKLTLLAHFCSGLALSVFMIGAFGLFARKLHLPLDSVRIAFIIAGVLLFGLLQFHGARISDLYRSQSISFISLLLFLFLAAFSVLVALQARFGGDDFSYLAYLTNWQHAPSLGFANVMFGSGGIEPVRFWLAMFPLDLALLSNLSGLHGLLLLGFYLEPALVVIAIVAVWALFEDLLQSQYQAMAALLLQLTFLFMLRRFGQPGDAFFTRLSEDKAFAAFILAPAFFRAIRSFLTSFTWRTGAVVLMTGFALTLTHPIILAYALFVAGVYAMLITLPGRNFRRLAITGALLVLIVLPAASLRFVGSPWVSRYLYGMGSVVHQPGVFQLQSTLPTGPIGFRFFHIKGTPFYSFNPQILVLPVKIGAGDGPVQSFFAWSCYLILGLGLVWSLFRIKRDPAAPFIAAASLLVLLAVLPYTGWLLGSFVSARMLWRIPWLLPIGLVGAVLWSVMFGLPGCDSVRARISFGLLSVLCLGLIGFYSIGVYSSDWVKLSELRQAREELTSLVTVGDYLESNLSEPAVFLAPRKLMDYLPGLSSKAKVVFFRVHKLTPYPVALDQLKLPLSPDASIPLKRRSAILKKYSVRFMLVPSTRVKDYYASFPAMFRIEPVGDLWMIEVLPSAP